MTDTTLDVPLQELDAFSARMQEITRSAGQFSSVLTGGLKAALVDGKSLDAVFRQIALTTSSRVLGAALKPLETLTSNAAGSLFSGLGPVLGGSLAQAASVTPFAKGGVIASPTYFGLGSNGAGGNGAFGAGVGMAGEAGAEAILPLVRGSDGRLGVQNGHSAAQPQVHLTITTRDADSFRRSEAQVSAMVARAVGRGRRGL